MVLTLIPATITPLNIPVLLTAVVLFLILGWLPIIGNDIYSLGTLSVDSITLL
jgi:hypothetical protein